MLTCHAYARIWPNHADCQNEVRESTAWIDQSIPVQGNDALKYRVSFPISIYGYSLDQAQLKADSLVNFINIYTYFLLKNRSDLEWAINPSELTASALAVSGLHLPAPLLFSCLAVHFGVLLQSWIPASSAEKETNELVHYETFVLWKEIASSLEMTLNIGLVKIVHSDKKMW